MPQSLSDLIPNLLGVFGAWIFVLAIWVGAICWAILGFSKVRDLWNKK